MNSIYTETETICYFLDNKLYSAINGKVFFGKLGIDRPFSLSNREMNFLKKGLKKGTYKIKVKVEATGDENYLPSAVKTVTFKVKVK